MFSRSRWGVEKYKTFETKNGGKDVTATKWIKKKRQTKSANLERVQNEDLLCYFLLTLSFRGLEANTPQYLSSRFFAVQWAKPSPLRVAASRRTGRQFYLFISFPDPSVRNLWRDVMMRFGARIS